MVGRRKRDYNGTVTGSCGHLCNEFPTIRENGRNKVFCDRCESPVTVREPDVQLTLFDDGEPSY